MFFSFDGIDGSGKSTQMDLFVHWLREQGHDVVTCRDPGTTPLGEAVRAILLGADYAIGARAELMLYMAARAQLVEEVIGPALDVGKIVVSDRFVLATVAYQGAGGGVAAGEVWPVAEVATRALLPDLTFLLDIEPAEAQQRMQRSLDRMESRGLEFFEKVRNGFRDQATRSPESIAMLCATEDVETIQRKIRELAVARLEGGP